MLMLVQLFQLQRLYRQTQRRSRISAILVPRRFHGRELSTLYTAARFVIHVHRYSSHVCSDLLARHERLLHNPESELPSGDKSSQNARNQNSKVAKPPRRKSYTQRNVVRSPIMPTTPARPAPPAAPGTLITPPGPSGLPGPFVPNDPSAVAEQTPNVPPMPYIAPPPDQAEKILPSPLSLNVSMDGPSSSMTTDFNPGGDPGLLFDSQPWPIDYLNFDATSLDKPFQASPDLFQPDNISSINQPLNANSNPMFSLAPPAAVNPLADDANLFGLDGISDGAGPTLSEGPLYLNPPLNTGLQSMNPATSPSITSITPMAGLDPDGTLTDGDIQAMLPLADGFLTQRPGWYDSTGPTPTNARTDPKPGS